MGTAYMEEHNEITPKPNEANAVPKSEEVEADGYYGDDELEDGELDLSFLDEEDDSPTAGIDKPTKADADKPASK